MDARGWGFFPSLLILLFSSIIPEPGISIKFEEERKKRVLMLIVKVMGLVCLAGFLFL